MNRPLISVIVPVFNTAGHLEGCLDSLLAQTLPGVEIILVDDGSTDGSPEICRRYERRHPDRIRLLTGSHHGVGTARNRGLDVASGDWIAFCDSDDRIDPDLYKTLYENAVREQADLSSCALRDIGPEGEKTVTAFPYSGRIAVRDRGRLLDLLFIPLLYSRRTVHGYLVIHLFKREIIGRSSIRFTPGIGMKEDELFLLEYLLETRCLTAVDTPLYYYIRTEGSACARYYRGRSDYFRERNWHLRAEQQLRIFRTGNLDRQYPAMQSELILRKYLHETQMNCCMPGISRRELSGKLEDIARRARAEKARNCGGLFWFFLLHGRSFLPLLCLAKRKTDELTRRIGHLKLK